MLLEGLRRGAVVFLAIAGVAEAIALLVWAFGGTGISLGDALALGWLELGAVHHVAIRVEIRDVVTAARSHIDLAVGVALLAVTVFAAWRLARAGARVSASATRPGRAHRRRCGASPSGTRSRSRWWHRSSTSRRAGRARTCRACSGSRS